ncbi:hypothetical protein CRG98_001976 [Punica granatum]|uniref:Uncharacterized protein n=1 Tax=Punica granatum TaxID=22663 RepID=A0A2I0LAC1_PUNGR|nr:hypothetical protein CRG98_001976 [Punica granatum]
MWAMRPHGFLQGEVAESLLDSYGLHEASSPRFEFVLESRWRLLFTRVLHASHGKVDTPKPRDPKVPNVGPDESPHSGRPSDPWRVFVLAMRMGSRFQRPQCEASGAPVGHVWAYQDVLNDAPAALSVVQCDRWLKTLLIKAVLNCSVGSLGRPLCLRKSPLWTVKSNGRADRGSHWSRQPSNFYWGSLVRTMCEEPGGNLIYLSLYSPFATVACFGIQPHFST